MRAEGVTVGLFLCLTLASSACVEITGVKGTTLSFAFAGGAEGWVGGFSDYPLAQRDEVEFVAEHRHLPQPLDQSEGALYQSGNNLSDDLFMFFKRRVEGLEPGRTYRVSYSVTIASNVAHGCDAGPGPMTHVKVGASTIEPLPDVIDQEGWVRMNIDVGSQVNDGANAVVVTDIRNQRPECSDKRYGLKKVDSEKGVEIQADETGALWLLIGTDSAWESPYDLYFSHVEARLTPL